MVVFTSKIIQYWIVKILCNMGGGSHDGWHLQGSDGVDVATNALSTSYLAKAFRTVDDLILEYWVPMGSLLNIAFVY